MWRIESSPLGRIAVPPVIPPGYAVFCTTRDFEGRLSPEIAANVTRAIEERFGIASALTTCNQVHGVAVRRASGERGWRECDSCDALWSDERGVALAIKIADCLPVTFIDPVHGVMANAHSGWRGAVGGVTAASLDAVAGETAFGPSAAWAFLGPSIRTCCFEVGEEVAAQFDGRYLDRSRAKAHVDLVTFTRDILLSRGFAEERISDSGLCTRCEGSVFHSYRKDGQARGRNLAIVAG
ncbi:MAG TPA: polyphenol oxidase family protein [Thermoanaerobaculia bacterium]|nr:polyphenol oxidase family protein [Thermoanaerobaculia bacterium]